MPLKDMPIRRKLMVIIFLITITALLLMRLVFFAYEFVTFRHATLRQLSTVGEVIANNSTAALAFANQDDAAEILSALRAEPNVTAAALYDQQGTLFSKYPAGLPDQAVPAAPNQDGFQSDLSTLTGFQPVLLGNKRLGTLYLRFDLGPLTHAWLRISITITLAVIGMVVLATYLLSRKLQQQISEPILALAVTAKAVSSQRDYSVRAQKFGEDELGGLTDAFNQMLADIGVRERALHQENAERKQAELALREAQALYHSLVEQLPAGVFRKDAAGRYVFVNSWFCQLGATLPEHYLGKTPLESGRLLMAHGSAALDVDQMMRLAAVADDHHAAIMRTGTRMELEEERILKDGRRQYMQVVKAPVLNAEGKVVGSQGTLIDITRRKLVEAEIRALNADLERRVQERTSQLEAANQELESFSYSVSHDLRAPLRHVQGYVEMLTGSLDGQLSDKARRYLKVISDASVEMGQLIDDLLAFSRMGRVEIRETPIRLDALVADAVHGLELVTQGRNIVWKIAPLPVVMGDPALLKQVFSNLIGNAVKYSRARNPAEIEIGSAPGQAQRLTLFVRDNGAGFDMKYVHKLFGVFQRLHRADEFEGTGIGLAIVRRVIARHGGQTWAEGQTGAGATFYFTLKPALEIQPHNS